MYHNCIHFCQKVGIPYLVIHGVSTAAIPQEQVDALNDRLYRELIPTLLAGGTVVCMENLASRGKDSKWQPGHCADAEAAVSFIDRLNNEAGQEVFGLCMDVGHLNLLGIDIPRYIRTLGKRIKVLHLHDNDGHADEHQAPYTGNIPWKAVMEALREVGYQGNIGFETFRQTSLKKIDEEVMLPWLQLICQCGKYFKSILEA